MRTYQQFESIPYVSSIGLRVETVEAEEARVRVPYKDENSNPGKALHGGVAASTIDIAGALAAGAADHPASLECGTLDLNVNYVAAAIGEEIFATARVLRRGKEITYSEVDVRTEAGKRIAVGLVAHRVFDKTSVPEAALRQKSTTWEDQPAEGEIMKGGTALTSVPFISRLGMRVERAHDGASQLRMPFLESNADVTGGVHEGAIAALLDTTGSVASWSITGLDLSYRASTVAIHVNYHSPTKQEDLVAQAVTLRRNNEIFLNQVTVGGVESGSVVATGTVTYRIVIP